MKDRLLRNFIVLIVIILFLPSSFAISKSSLENRSDLPDFAITDIGTTWDMYGVNRMLYSIIVNIGDAGVFEEYEINYWAHRIIFSFYKVYKSDHHLHPGSQGFQPGKWIEHQFTYVRTQLPWFGIIKFCSHINPDRLIEESNYDNNYYEETFIVFLTKWMEYNP